MAPPLLLAGALTKGLPLAAGALKYLPVIGAVGGALPGLRKGNLGEAALGSGFGALSGSLGTGGLITGATGAVGRMAGKKGVQQALKKGATAIGGKQLAGQMTKANIQQAVKAGVPLAGAAGVFGLAQAGGDMGLPPSGGGAGGAVRGAAGLAGYGSVRGENMVQVEFQYHLEWVSMEVLLQ